MRSLRASFVVAATTLALFGLGRFIFNLMSVRLFGPEFVGHVNVSLSTWTVVTVLLGTVPAFTTSKYAAEFVARGEAARARNVFTACLGAVVLPGVIIAFLSMGIAGPRVGAWAWYVPLFGAYLVMKAAAFAFGAQRGYLKAELAGFGVFLGLCGFACALRAREWAAAAILLQPAAIAPVAVWTLRREFAWRGALHEFASRWRDYRGFLGATLINASAGLVSYHLAIVLAGILLKSRADVGYLSVLLSSLAPLNLLPTALGTSLFPEIARRYGAGDEEGQRRAIARATLALQAFTMAFGTALLLVPEMFLRLMHVPADGPVRVTWLLLAWVLQVTIVSSPSGHFLNATRFATRHAMASLGFLMLGIALGVMGFLAVGLVGAGIMRVGVDAGLAWVRMVMAERRLQWSSAIRGTVIACQASLASALIIGLWAPGWGWRVGTWTVSILTQTTSVKYLAREPGRRDA